MIGRFGFSVSAILSRARARFGVFAARIADYRLFYQLERFTMISQSKFAVNLGIARWYAEVPGAVVECGTWKGGMIAGLANALGCHRDYYLYDSFEGLPPAQACDGEAARRWQADKTSPGYFDNCKASENDAREAMEFVGVFDARIVKGWFRDTLPEAHFPEGIAILRMDADWYEPTLEILNHLFRLVNRGGVIIIDDYHMWEGCSRAVHEFLATNHCAERINERFGVCYITKVAERVVEPTTATYSTPRVRGVGRKGAPLPAN